MSPLLIFDSHYLCHRAFHSLRGLSWQEKPTGVIFGFLKTISQLKNEFGTDSVAFCFEHKESYRRQIYPGYKRKRGEVVMNDQEREARAGLALQISELRQRYLPAIGFKNVFSFQGMESDDIIAKLAFIEAHRRKVILITADSDLYQCLNENTSLYAPASQKLVTGAKFFQIYGIQPGQWSLVKAVGGCKSDQVQGVPGVGETTALKFVRGELKAESAAFKAITSAEGRHIVMGNRELVELPLAHCPTPELQVDQVSKAAWLEVCRSLGMKSLSTQPPMLRV